MSDKNPSKTIPPLSRKSSSAITTTSIDCLAAAGGARRGIVLDGREEERKSLAERQAAMEKLEVPAARIEHLMRAESGLGGGTRQGIAGKQEIIRDYSESLFFVFRRMPLFFS